MFDFEHTKFGLEKGRPKQPYELASIWNNDLYRIKVVEVAESKVMSAQNAHSDDNEGESIIMKSQNEMNQV